MDELKRLEMTLKQTLTDKKDMTKEKIDKYLSDLDEIEKNIDSFRERVKTFANDIGRKGRLIKDSTVEKTRDVLNEIEKTLNPTSCP